MVEGLLSIGPTPSSSFIILSSECDVTDSILLLINVWSPHHSPHIILPTSFSSHHSPHILPHSPHIILPLTKRTSSNQSRGTDPASIYCCISLMAQSLIFVSLSSSPIYHLVSFFVQCYLNPSLPAPHYYTSRGRLHTSQPHTTTRPEVVFTPASTPH